MTHTLHERSAEAALYGDAASFVSFADPQDCLAENRAQQAGSFRIDAQCELTALVAVSAQRVIAADYAQDSFRRSLAVEGVRTTDEILAVLTLVARLLGDMWLADSCTFNDVTFGMHRLTLLLMALEPTGADADARPQHGGRVFLAPAPGDQHGFGLAMVGYHLRRDGWDVSAELDASEDRIVDHIAARAYDCVGFSVGHERAVTPLTALIQRIRQYSRRASLAIMVGGPMIVANPALAEEMGADLWAEDGIALCGKLNGLLSRSAV